MPAFASPAFQQGYKKAQGEALASRFEQDLIGAYNQWSGRYDQDPEALTEFLQQYTRDYIGKSNDDPDILRGLFPRFKQVTESVLRQNTRDRADQAYKTGLNAHTAAVNQLIDYDSTAGLLRKEGTDYESLWANILRTREQALSLGIRAEDFDKELMVSISAKTLEIGDHKLVELLDRALPGTTYKLSDLPDGRDLKNDTITKLLSISQERQEELRKKQEREDKQRYNSNLSTVLTEITANPNAEVPDGLMREMEKVDPDVRIKIAGARKTLSEAGGGIEDPAEIRDLYGRIMDGRAGRGEILRAVEKGIIRDPSTITALTTFADKFEGDSGQAGRMLGSDTAKQYLTTISLRTSPKDGDGAVPIVTLDGRVAGITDAGLAATADFRRFIVEWSADNPNASYAQQMQAVTDFGERILKSIDVRENSPTKFQYFRPEDAPGAPLSGATLPEPQASPSAAAPSPAQPSLQELDAERLERSQGEGLGDRRTLDQFPEGERRLIENAAKRAGVPPNLYLQQMWRIEDRARLRRQQRSLQGTEGSDRLEGGIGPTADPAINSLLDTARRVATGLGLDLGEGAGEDDRPSPRSLVGFSRGDPEDQRDQGIDSPFPQDAATAPAPVLDRSGEAGIGDQYGRFKPSAIKGLIIHHTGGRGSAESVVETFKQRGYPAQYVLERDGSLVRVLPEGAKGRHMRNGKGPGAGYSNANTEGIEVIAEDNNDWTEAQKQTLARFAIQHARDHGYDPLKGIFGHGEVNPHKQATEGQAFVAWFRRHYGSVIGDGTRMAGLE